MCGINGIVHLRGNGDYSTAVKAMNSRMSHRGPDDEGVWMESGIALGHRRLSIIDLSAAGHQPMFSHDQDKVIVFNGEIYNFRDIRKELTDYPFRTFTDTEVILAAWNRWGVNCLHRFNGMFAFAVYEKSSKRLTIVRDRFGVKPVYWNITDDLFTFSSEIRSLLASGNITPRLNRQVLNEYVAYQTVHAPNTILEGIQMLLPGHIAVIENGSYSISRWWTPSPAELKGESYPEIKNEVARLFRSAVERRLVADVPFGAFLSGGIDSSAVVAVMSEMSSAQVKTFNVTFDSSEFSESVYARQIAQRFNTDHHEILLTPQDFLEQLPHALDAMDHPGGDGPNTYVVAGATRKAGITMALSGLGGDEVFAGYDVFQRVKKIEDSRLLRSSPVVIRRIMGSLLKAMKPGPASEKMSSLLREPAISFDQYYRIFRQVLSESKVKSVTGIEGSVTFPSELNVYGMTDRSKDHLLSRVSLYEMSTYMQNVLLRDTDQMSMAHALEVRVPFLDVDLVNYVLGVKDEFKYPVTPKKLLTDALGDALPDEIVHRPKMGFTFPWKLWMRNELKEFSIENLRYLSEEGVIDKGKSDELWNKFMKDDPEITWSRLWHLVVLGYWIRKNKITVE